MSDQNKALARKHRPKRFEGPDAPRDQEHVTGLLKRAVANGRVAQAYLFAGPRGTGKTTLARILAAALNCPQRSADGEPCAECENCRRIHEGRETMDVVEMDAASNRGVDDARHLREQTMYAASQEGGWKVYIIDEAHMLTKEAWNSLLKVLEEPPPNVVFVACTTEPEKILRVSEAVASRFQRHNLRRITEQEIAHQLRVIAEREGIAISNDALDLIGHLAHGGMRDAIGLLDEMRSLHVDSDQQITGDDIRRKKGIPPESLHLGAIDILANGGSDQNRGRVFDLAKQLYENGNQFPVFVTDFQSALIALQAIRCGRVPDGPWSEGWIAKMQRYRTRLSSAAIAAALRVIMDHREEIRGANPQIAFFSLMQNAITVAESLTTPEEVE